MFERQVDGGIVRLVETSVFIFWNETALVWLKVALRRNMSSFERAWGNK